MQDGTLIIGPAVIGAGEDSDNRLSRLKAFQNRLMASHNSHQVVLTAEGISAVL